MTRNEFDPDQKKKTEGRLSHTFYPLLFLPVVILSFLVGCQLQNSVESALNTTVQITKTLPASTVEVETSPSVTTIATPTAAGSNKLILWLPPQFDPQSETAVGELIKNRLAAFEQENPKWTIEVRLKSLEGRGGILDSLANTSIAAPDALPILVALNYKDMESATLKGLLLPLDGKVSRKNQKDWLPYVQKLGMIQNIEYGVPFAGDALVMVYRPQQSPYPPSTWQELTSQTLPVFFPAADPNAVVVTTLYQTVGGNFSPVSDAPILDEAMTQKTFSLINNGMQSGAFPIWLSGYTTFADSWQAFLEQHSGYAFAWASQFFADSESDDALIPLPAISSTQITRADGWVWCVPEMNTQSQEIAISLSDFLSDPDFVNQLDQLAGYLPVYTSGLDLIEDPDLKNNVTILTSTAQIVPTSSTINLINPVFENATIQIIKKQLYYQQAVDQVLSQVNK